jgi:hypothetical protein
MCKPFNYVSNEHPAIMLHLGGQSAHLNYLAHMTRYINNTVKDKHSSYIANRKRSRITRDLAIDLSLLQSDVVFSS